LPKVAEFYGVPIYVYYREHLLPHFHAMYAGDEAEIAIDGPAILARRLPPRALGLVMEWAARRRPELARVRAQAEAHQPLD
jgi:hypothetical protein